MRKVLLAAIDASPQRLQVLAKAAEMAGCMAAELHVMSVNDLSRHREFSFAVPTAEMVSVMDMEVRAVLEEARQNLDKQGITCHVHAPYGVTAEQIVLLARYLRTDIIIIGHRHLSWLGRLVEDSVGSDLLAHSPCNVLIVVEPQTTDALDEEPERLSRSS
ncbi:MAG TPA: universal stress protein [Telmatospirillum sp.]|nr:universal stress protein [Telmatospirillum sp.]